MEMVGLVWTPTEWYAIGTAFHQDAICRRSLDEGEPSGNECSDNGSKAEERKVIENDPSFIGMPLFLLDSFSLREGEY